MMLHYTDIRVSVIPDYQHNKPNCIL